LTEHLPIGLAAELPGHAADTVSGRGWSGIKNGELLRRMSGQYDALVTMDRSIEFQQRIATLRFGIVLVRARSNRMQDLRTRTTMISAKSTVYPSFPRKREPRSRKVRTVAPCSSQGQALDPRFRGGDDNLLR
jgi:hypothetical protein